MQPSQSLEFRPSDFFLRPELDRLRSLGWQCWGGWPRAWKSYAESGNRRLYLVKGITKETLFRSIVSSPVPREGEDLILWQKYLETGLMEIARERSCLLVNLDVPVGARIQHAAHRMGLSYRILAKPRPSDTFDDWTERCRTMLEHPSADSDRTIWVSPPIDVANTSDLPGGATEESTAEWVPIPDRMLCRLPDRVYAIWPRPQGRIESELVSRLDSGSYPPGQVHVAVKSQTARAGAKSGGVHWDEKPGVVIRWVQPPRATRKPRRRGGVDSGVATCSLEMSDRTYLTSDWIQQEKEKGWGWLTHCTRANEGRWPDETESQYADRVLLDPFATGAHTPEETLSRIVSMNRLIGTTHLKRSTRLSVCFSEVPIDELLARRSFQRHLRRWDWEPYGICIRQEALSRLGARPCLYGSPAFFEKLSEEDRPFFQLQPSLVRGASKGQRGENDWELEREWRILGDLRLAGLTPEEAIVFVPTVTLAEKIGRLTPFPILVVQPSPNHCNDVKSGTPDRHASRSDDGSSLVSDRCCEDTQRYLSALACVGSWG